MSKYEKYTLAVGEAGAERLCIVNVVCNPFTLETIDKQVNLSGKRVLDFGCGTGLMTIELAKRVGSNGHVVAVDISAEQLAIAEKNLQQNNLQNVEFVELAADDLEKLNQQFDFIYSRFVLMHLENPTEILKKMVALLKPGGKILAEEAVGYEVIYSDPEHDCIKRYRDICIARMNFHHSNVHIGKHLHSIFQQRNLAINHSKIIQPVLRSEEEKSLPWLGMVETKNACSEQGLITESEMQDLIADLKEVARDKTTVIGLINYLQILASKN